MRPLDELACKTTCEVHFQQLQLPLSLSEMHTGLTKETLFFQNFHKKMLPAKVLPFPLTNMRLFSAFSIENDSQYQKTMNTCFSTLASIGDSAPLPFINVRYIDVALHEDLHNQNVLHTLYPLNQVAPQHSRHIHFVLPFTEPLHRHVTGQCTASTTTSRKATIVCCRTLPKLCLFLFTKHGYPRPKAHIATITLGDQ